MRLKHVGNAILFIAALQHFELNGADVKFPPKIVVFTGGVFWHRLFLRSVTPVIAVNMRGSHSVNAAVRDEI